MRRSGFVHLLLWKLSFREHAAMQYIETFSNFRKPWRVLQFTGAKKSIPTLEKYSGNALFNGDFDDTNPKIHSIFPELGCSTDRDDLSTQIDKRGNFAPQKPLCGTETECNHPASVHIARIPLSGRFSTYFMKSTHLGKILLVRRSERTASPIVEIVFKVENLFGGGHKTLTKNAACFWKFRFVSKKIDDSCVGAGKSESEIFTLSLTLPTRLCDLRNIFCKSLIQFLQPSKVDLGVPETWLGLAFSPTVCTKTTTGGKFGPCYSPP